jgi:hypothetical protein
MSRHIPSWVTGVPDKGGVLPGVDLEHRWAAVSGLPHDGVGVRAGPERFGDKPGAQ